MKDTHKIDEAHPILLIKKYGSINVHESAKQCMHMVTKFGPLGKHKTEIIAWC